MVAQTAAHNLLPNEEVKKTVDPPSKVHMTWTEDAAMNESKPCLQRDVTEIDVSKRGV